MNKKMNKIATIKIFRVIVFFVLVGIFIAYFVIAETPEELIIKERGANYQIIDNEDGTFTWSNQPRWIYNGSEYVPYIFIDNYDTDNYYQIQSGLIGVKIYDYYSEFYSPDMNEIRLYDERWEVQEFTNKWKDIGAQSGTPVFSIETTSTSVIITKTFTSWAGELSMAYIFREGGALKHTINFTSYQSDEHTYRVIQKWAGIVGSKVKHSNGLDEITTTTILDSSYFRFQKEDGTLSVFENQWKMYYDEFGDVLLEQNLKPVEIDTHAQGMKANFIFAEWTLVDGESLIIDPDTATFDNPTEDGQITSGFSRNSGDVRIRIDSSTSLIGYIEWDISSIRDGSTITDTVFKYHGAQDYLDCHIREMLGARPSTSSNEAVFNEASEGTIYYNTPGFPAVGTNRQVDLGTDADSDLQSLLSEDWFAIGMEVITPGEDYSRIYAEEYDATPDPTLFVTYERGPPTMLITLYATTGASHLGDFGGRSGVDSFCSDNKPAAVTCSGNIHALVSVTPTDEIRDMPAVYGYEDDAQIKWANSSTGSLTTLAANWSDMLDESILVSKEDGTGDDASYWTGSYWWGGAADRCDSWLDARNIYTGIVGYADRTDGGWLNVLNHQCDYAHELICACESDLNTCTYTSGNWNVECSDYCNITTVTSLPSNNLTLSGTGTFTILANITASMVIMDTNCQLINLAGDNKKLMVV